jgi:hypothetical protein
MSFDLFFDEADALFGRPSSVDSARDRYSAHPSHAA